MALKIFVPDIKDMEQRKLCVPVLHPFITNDWNIDKRIKVYGEWINDIVFVNNIIDSDIVLPMHYVNYYAKRKEEELHKINETAIRHHKITVCFTNGDWGKTPALTHFHLYRHGGYRSKNGGNQFCLPFFLGHDPVEKFCDNTLPLNEHKPQQPLIGFCGRSSGNIFFYIEDVMKNIRRAILYFFHKWHEDVETFCGSSMKRYFMLKRLQASTIIKTNFILNKAFISSKNHSKENAALIYYKNISESDYVFCYRGWGNFSIRLYEAMACGKIPVIILSDNNLPFESEIEWSQFPIIEYKHRKKIDAILASFHKNLSNDDFIKLQLNARFFWINFFTYKGFMSKFIAKYNLKRLE